MKKLLTISLLAASFFADSAFAKTEGSYFGVDLLSSNIRFAERYSNNTTPTTTRRPAFIGSDYGLGAHYEYAVNANGLFIAPGLFFEQNSVKATGDGNETTSSGNRTSQRMQVTNRYGIKANIGFDITDRFAAYVTGGYAMISYKNKNFSDPNGDVTAIKTGAKGAGFYGVGFKFDCDKETSLSLEYNTQSFSAPTAVNNVNGLSSVYKTRLDVVKVGLAYRF